MTSVQAVDVGAEGLAYLRERLSEGGALAQLTRDRLGMARTAFSLLSAGTPAGREKEFETGGSIPEAEVIVKLAALLGNRCGDAPEWCLLLEDSWAQRGDVSRVPCPRFHIGSTALVGVARPDAELIRTALRATISFDFLGFAAASPLPPTCEIDQHVLSHIAATTRVVLASAYDRESVVLAELT